MKSLLPPSFPSSNMSSVQWYRCYPELGNLSCAKLIPDQGITIYLIMLYTFTICTGILNLMVIIAISHFRQLHSSPNFILLNLAISDFLMCCVGIPLQGSVAYTCWRFGDIMCALVMVFLFTLISVSVGGMILISIDRYVAICDPMHYSTLMCRRSVSIALIACWIISVLYGIGYYHDNVINPGRHKMCEGDCYTVVTNIAGYVDLAVNFCGPFVLIIILYLRVFFVAVSQARAKRFQVAATTQQPAVNSRKSELKAARNLGFVVFLFLLCYTPFYVVDPRENMNYYFKVFLFHLIYLNSCFNPLLYALLYPWFRRSVKQIVMFRILQSGSRDANVL